jgi:hypothetical protein
VESDRVGWDRVGTPSPSAGRPRCGGIITEKENIPFAWSGNGSIHFLLLDAWSEGYDNVRVG